MSRSLVTLYRWFGAAALVCASCSKPSQSGGATSADNTQAPAPTAPAAAAQAAIQTREVTYSARGTTLKGYLAAPSGSGKHPGILIVHEWWGVNEYPRARARQLAELGYVAFALDMYGNGQTVDTPDAAKQLAHGAWADPEVLLARFQAAREVLASDPHTAPDHIGAIGYCFGGGVVLEAARRGADLDAAVSFHGNLDTEKPMAPGAFKGKVFVATGGDDPMVPAEHVEGIKKELAAAGVDAEVVVYAGASHAFSNPAATEIGKKFSLPIRYDAAADAASWQKMQELFAKTWTHD